MNQSQPLWQPSQELIDNANMTRFIAEVNRQHGRSLSDYDGLYQWSIEEKEDFWSALWDFCEVIGDKGDRVLIDGDDIEKADRLPGAERRAFGRRNRPSAQQR